MTEVYIIGKHYTNTADVPKGDGIYYRCMDCGDSIPSVPDDSIGCRCGNVAIDKDCWRLMVVNFGQFEVYRKIK